MVSNNYEMYVIFLYGLNITVIESCWSYKTTIIDVE